MFFLSKMRIEGTSVRTHGEFCEQNYSGSIVLSNTPVVFSYLVKVVFLLFVDNLLSGF